jgi:hypothetical protein
MATRQFLLSIKTSQGEQASIYTLLLSRLCLNRYYLAEGVRIFSQKTWELIVGPAGKEVVERHIGSFVNYYISCTQFDNHAVREVIFFKYLFLPKKYILPKLTLGRMSMYCRVSRQDQPSCSGTICGFLTPNPPWVL